MVSETYIGSTLLSLIEGFPARVESNPLMLLSFIIPVVVIWISSVTIRGFARRTKIDAPPTLEQRREQFTIPRDFFSRESKYVRELDIEHFIGPIKRDFDVLRQYPDYFDALEKRYRKYSRMAESSRTKRKKRGETGKLDTFNEILNLYNRLRKSRFETIEFEEEEK